MINSTIIFIHLYLQVDENFEGHIVIFVKKL